MHSLIGAFLPAIGLPAEENQQFLREITDENGLLKEQAQGLYGFMHLTLQEYFTAKYVVDHQEVKELLSHVRRSIADALSKLIDTQEDIKRLCNLLADKTIEDAVYRALSEICLRMRVRIIVVDGVDGTKSFEVVPWS